MKKLIMIAMTLMLNGCVGSNHKLIKLSAQYGCLKACHVFMDGPKLTDKEWQAALDYCEKTSNEIADETN